MSTDVEYATSDVEALYAIEPAFAKMYLEAWDRGLRTNEMQAWAGLLAGFLVAVLALALSCWLIVSGHEVSGTIIGSADVLALTALFVTRTRE